VTEATKPGPTHRCATERARQFRRRLFEVIPVDVVEREVGKPLPKLKPIPGAEIRCVTPTQPAGGRDLLPRWQWRGVEDALARGDRGYVAVVEGSFAGRIWVSRVSHRDRYTGIKIRLAPDEAYTYAMDVEMPYRSLGVGAAVVAAMLSDLEEGHTTRRVYGWVDSRNRESQALLRMVFGFTQVQTVKRLHVPRVGWQIPGSDEPPFGPASRVGRHSQATRG
jgi:hypothetical protein